MSDLSFFLGFIAYGVLHVGCRFLIHLLDDWDAKQETTKELTRRIKVLEEKLNALQTKE